MYEQMIAEIEDDNNITLYYALSFGTLVLERNAISIL